MDKKSGAQAAKLFLDEGHKRIPQSSDPADLVSSWLDVQARLGGAQSTFGLWAALQGIMESFGMEGSFKITQFQPN